MAQKLAIICFDRIYLVHPYAGATPMKPFLTHFLVWMLVSSVGIRGNTTCPLTLTTNPAELARIYGEIAILVLKILST